MKNILLIFLILFFIVLTKCDKNKDGKGNEDKGGGKNDNGGGEENNEGGIGNNEVVKGDNGGGEENKGVVEEGIEGGEVEIEGGKGNKGGGNGNKGGGKEDKGGGNGNGNKGGGNGKGKQKKLINGIDADYYAPDDADGYSPAAKRRIMRYCTEYQNDPECKPEWIITEGEIPEAPYGPGKGKGKGKKFPKFKKHAKKPPKKHKIKDPTEGLPNKYKKKLPPGKVKKMKKEHIDALRKNCPGNSCKEDKDEHRHSRATLADYDVALLKLAYPDKSLEEIDEYVETKMQRVYELKEIIYEKLGVHDFSKPADNGLYGHNLLTLEQAEAYIAQLNSSLEYSYAIPDENNKRRKRAGNLLYFKTSPTRKWPIGTPIPYGFDKSLNTRQRNYIRTCINEITSKTCVRFTETNLDATSERPPNISSIYFVRYPTTAYCGLSYIGVYTPSNPIYLSFLCNDMAGVACHEVMHALGVEHEHIRPDRDDSITVLWDNIDAQFLDYYVPADGSTYSSYGIPYKCDSIMHYSYKIGARDYGLHTMTCKVDPDINDPLMGQRKGLTQADVDAINKLYCYPEECTDNSNFCGAWATQGLCYCPTSGKPNCYMVQNCPNSCNFCTCTQYED